MFGIGVSPGQPENILETALVKSLVEVRQSPGREGWNCLDKVKWRGGLRHMAAVGQAQGQKLWTFTDL